uniref:Uncharacterized protein n=1 Tax=Fagus sylvatica TaxID=28930 RepID=A0A2N9FCT1_FAGSY
MVLSLRLLLLQKPALHLHFRKIGIPKSPRWCSSSPSFRKGTEQSLLAKKLKAEPEVKK